MSYNGIVKSFFLDCALALHDLVHDELRIALYEDRNAISPDTESYSPVGEVIAQNYSPGGLQIFTTEGWPRTTEEYAMECRFDAVRFSSITASIGAALIYNAVNNRAIRCIDFGENTIVVSSDFNIAFPMEAQPPICIKLPLR